MLEIKALHAGYRGKTVLKAVSLTARAGEVTAVLGRNGSGKSTLLRAAMGLIPSTAESVTLFGADVCRIGVRERAKQMAYIPQTMRADSGITALEAVLMGANARTPLLASYTAAQRQEARYCLERVGLVDEAETVLGALSQGQQRLVLFARAMMQRPKVYLMDEPDGALDMQNRWAVLRMAGQRAAREGSAVLCTLHDVSLALSLCDRVCLLGDGAVCASFAPKEMDEAAIRAALYPVYGAVRVLFSGDAAAVLPERE